MKAILFVFVVGFCVQLFLFPEFHSSPPSPTLNSSSFEKYYQIQDIRVHPPLLPLFFPLHFDEELNVFLATPKITFFQRIQHFFAKKWFTHTNLLGFLGRGSMHVLSKNQITKLYENAIQKRGGEVKEGERWGRLLDIGAGTGYMTEKLVPFFDDVVATEVSSPMVQSLRSRNITAVETGDLHSDEWLKNQKFNFISCLNVLDRCDRPHTLLKQIHQSLVQSSSPSPPLLLLAVVFPFDPFVETPGGQASPQEILPIKGKRFENSLNSLIEDVLVPLGFDVLSFSRVPYVSIEDRVYVMDNGIFMLTPSKTE